MEDKPIAIAFSDLHFHDWKNYSVRHKRLGVNIKILKLISDKAIKYQVPVLFAGDLFHDPMQLTNRVFVEFLKSYKLFFEEKKIDFFAISGNHDQSSNNYFNAKSYNYLIALDIVFETFKLVDFRCASNKDLIVGGIPFIKDNVDFKKSLDYITKIKVLGEDKGKKKLAILLIHTNLPGAKEPNGLIVSETDNIPLRMNKFFKGWDLILSGHIHKPQKISKKVYMLGATNQQRRSDMGCDMGYWLIYKNRKPKFVKIKAPEFKPIEEGKEIPNDGNYYIPIIKQEENTEEGTKFNFITTDKKAIAKEYCKIKGIKKKSKRRFLISILDKIDND